jgi:hypothetical protein
MAAFFGKLGERVKIDQTTTPPTFETTLGSRPFGEYRMPDQDDSKKFYPVSARFLLDGTGPGRLAE